VETQNKINIFVSYSHIDKEWIEKVDERGNYNKRNLIPWLEECLKDSCTFWYDHALSKTPGALFKETILKRIKEADAAILLLSQNFFNSDFIRKTELPAIYEKVKEEAMLLLPILVGRYQIPPGSPMKWVNDRQIIPRDLKPLVDSVDNPADWNRASDQILSTILEIIPSAKSSPSSSSSPKSDEKPLIIGPSIKLQTESCYDKNNKSSVAENTTQKKSYARIVLFSVLAIILMISLSIAIYYYFTPKDDKGYIKNRDSFLGAMPWLNWIIYDPTGYNPYENKFPSEASIRKDLRILRKYYFNGLITMTSDQPFRNVAQIAHEEGFNMVIVGIWDLRNKQEVDNAFKAANYADAYCLGDRGLIKSYTIGELENLMEQIRKITGRPVTTTEVLAEYETNSKLIELGDFLFPDVHVQWYDGLEPEKAWEETIILAQRAAKAASNAPGKLILLKMVSYPSGGAEGLSQEAQLSFYQLAIEKAINRTDIPARISFSFLTSFDPVWKTDEQKWEPSERYTGLFTYNREPKLAITQVNWEKYR